MTGVYTALETSVVLTQHDDDRLADIAVRIIGHVFPAGFVALENARHRQE